MEKIEFERGLEFEHGEEGEYILRFKTPKVKISADPTGGHLKQARKEILLAVRSLIDEAIGDEEKKDEG